MVLILMFLLVLLSAVFLSGKSKYYNSKKVIYAYQKNLVSVILSVAIR